VLGVVYIWMAGLEEAGEEGQGVDGLVLLSIKRVQGIKPGNWPRWPRWAKGGEGLASTCMLCPSQYRSAQTLGW
jgi:hypothetical protein